MNLIEILLLSFALSVDATIISFSYGIKTEKDFFKIATQLAVTTGFFQGLMPLIGGICTECVRDYIEPFAKWIIFAIFMYLGIIFIMETFKKKKETKTLTMTVLFFIGIATSIDALSAGVPIALNTKIFKSVLIITFITLINSYIGFFSGHIFKKFNPKYLCFIGGLILIALALKVVIF